MMRVLVFSDVPNVYMEARFALPYCSFAYLTNRQHTNLFSGGCQFVCPLFPNQDIHRITMVSFICKVCSLLKEKSPDVCVIPGWHLSFWRILHCICILRGIKVVYTCESTATPRNRTVIGKCVRILKGAFVKNANGFFVGGFSHIEYLKELGFDYGVPVVAGLDGLPAIAFSNTNSLKLCSNEIVLAYSGRFVERKNVSVLLDLLMMSQDYRLRVYGDGPLLQGFQEQAKALGIIDRIVFYGFMERADLIPQLGKADCLILPSHFEPWGLVINDAVFAEVPVVIHRFSGSAGELGVEGLNAALVDDFADLENLDCCVRRACRLNPSKREWKKLKWMASTERSSKQFFHLLAMLNQSKSLISFPAKFTLIVLCFFNVIGSPFVRKLEWGLRHH